jgi:hypothetical protein
MQIIPNTSFGSSLGQSLGTGLNQLADLKLAQLTKQYDIQNERNQFAQGLEPVLGKDTANFLSYLSPEERKNALQNIGSLVQLNQAPSSREQAGSLGALSNPQQLQAQQEPGQPQQQITPERAKLLEEVFISPQEKRERRKLELAEKQTNIKETKQYIDTLKTQEKAAKESDLRLKRMEKLIEKGNLPNANLWSFLSKVEDLGPTATAGAGALLGTAGAGAVIGSVVPGVGTAIGAGIGALAGALSGPLAGAAKSYIKSGSPDVEEFEKLSNDFIKNAKQYFGSRLTDADLRAFMQTVPTLMQTDAGKKRVIENLRSLNELAEIEVKAARSIIKENRGVPPIDIEQQVKDKISNKIDKVANKFIIK